MSRAGRRARLPFVALIASIALVAAPARAMSPVEEAELGRRFALEARAKVPLVDDVDVNRYVERIGRKIVATLGEQPFTYEFFVVQDGSINAFAVPGGYVFLHAGLLTQVRSEDEIAGVLGHEIAHVHAHHLARQQEATQLLNYAALLGVLLSVVQPALGAGALAAQAAAQLEYRREFEQEADYMGARFMQSAGYESIGMLDFFKRLSDRQRRAAVGDMPPYLLTHPLSEDRLTNLEAVLRERQWDQRPRRALSLELERVQLLTAMRAQQREEIVRLYVERAEQQPNDGRARYLQGLALFEVGRLDAAAAAFEAAQARGFTEVERELGRVRFRQRRGEEAKELLEKAVAAAPDDPVAQHALAAARAGLGDTAGALAAYRAALAAAPQMEAAHYDLGKLAGRSGDVGSGFYHLGMAYKLRGEYAQAILQFEQAKQQLDEKSEMGKNARAALLELGVSE